MRANKFLSGEIVRIFLQVIASFLFVVTPVASIAASAWNPIEAVLESPTIDGVAVAAREASKQRCEFKDCRSLILLDYLTREVGLYGAGTANGLNSLYTGNLPIIAGMRLDAHLLNHPNLYPGLCAFGVRLFSQLHTAHTPITPGPFVEMFLAAADMDSRGGGTCTRSLSEVLRDTPSGRLIRENAYQGCLSGSENHRRSIIVCEAIRGSRPND